jgi:Flp pilus assembly protein TadG
MRKIASCLTVGGGYITRLLRRFRRGEQGASTVEFAMVVAPFLALLFAILETAIIFFASQTLETAVADSARLILTGQAQAQSYTPASFKQQVCSRIMALFDCANGLYVDVKTYKTFKDVDDGLKASPLDADRKFVDNSTYSPGVAGDIVVVRLMYQWPVYVSLLGMDLSNMAGNKRLLMATAVFRNEPF